MARDIFGESSSKQSRRWLEYWRAALERNQSILESFENLIPIDFAQARVLDVGCGNGGLAPIVKARDGHYVGTDYHFHVLQAADRERFKFLQASASSLPFSSESCELIFCFDVIEHLEGGKKWQRRFLSEISRVLTPSGLCFLTTPNFYYPYDAHTQLCGPQYLPAILRDHYIRLKNPDFIREHGSFNTIHLLKPRFFRRALREAGLSPLHDLPCGLDRGEFFSIHPFRGLLAYLGLGWYLHAEFWPILVRSEAREKIRRKLRKNWRYHHRENSSRSVERFDSHIDFRVEAFSHQLASGWHYYERYDRGCRWTSRRASCFLESRQEVSYVTISGFAPQENRLNAYIDDVWIGEMQLESGKNFRAQFLIPLRTEQGGIFEVRLEAEKTRTPEGDQRELGLLIFEVRIS